MKELKLSKQFKKDLKRIQHNPRRIANVKSVLAELRDTGKVSSKYKPHLLSGDYIGCMECHVEDDLLLIWIDGDVVSLLRLGSHSELF